MPVDTVERASKAAEARWSAKRKLDSERFDWVNCTMDEALTHLQWLQQEITEGQRVVSQRTPSESEEGTMTCRNCDKHIPSKPLYIQPEKDAHGIYRNFYLCTEQCYGLYFRRIRGGTPSK